MFIVSQGLLKDMSLLHLKKILLYHSLLVLYETFGQYFNGFISFEFLANFVRITILREPTCQG